MVYNISGFQGDDAIACQSKGGTVWAEGLESFF